MTFRTRGTGPSTGDEGVQGACKTADKARMTRRSIAALAAGMACLLVAAGAAGSADSTITRQDSKAQSTARNMVSYVEACWTDTQDYRQCRTEQQLSMGIGSTGLPIGAHRGQVRMTAARRDSFTIDSWSRSGNHFLVVKHSSGVLIRKCTTAGRGGCFHNGRW